MNHQKWMDVAERIDSLRIFPRLFLISCFWFAVKVTFILVLWYIRLPGSERGTEASGFGAVVLLGIMAFLKMVFADYSANGRDWNQRGAVTQTTVAQMTTSTAP